MGSKNRKDFQDKTLEKAIEITRKQGALLSSIYDDMFGKSSRPKKEEAPKEEFDVSDALDKMREGLDAWKEAGSSSEEAVKNADNVIKEAKDVFADEIKAQEAEADTSSAKAEAEKTAEPEKDPMVELEELIGLSKIKHDVKELTSFVKVQKMRKDEGLKSVPVSLHMVFTGNPGTGKTTVARLLGRLYKQIGVLSKGQLIEVDRSGLVAGYLGQTALKCQEVIKSAMGGVLFIDEAYALSQKDDAFGQEAVDTILKAMEDHRDDLIVIVAGYTEPMRKFIDSNPGLKSRFNKYIEFPDYTIDELEAMFYQNCRRYDYVADEDVKKHIRTMIATRKLMKLENFANGREVRNMFEEIITNQARRVASLENPAQEDLKAITVEDLMDKEAVEVKAEDLEYLAAEAAGVHKPIIEDGSLDTSEEVSTEEGAATPEEPEVPEVPEADEMTADPEMPDYSEDIGTEEVTEEENPEN